MAQKTLTTSYLAKLSNANHDGVTQQIDDRLQGYETDNLKVIQAAEGVHTARQSATQVLQLVSQRVENESAKVKGELADARKQTDAAIRKAFDIVNALNVIEPSEALTQLTTLLLGIEERAKLYYISSGKKTEPEPEPDGGDEPAPSGDDTPSGDGDGGGGEVTPVTPE